MDDNMWRVLVIFSCCIALTMSSCLDGWNQSPIDSNICYYVSISDKIWSEAENFCTTAAPNGHLTSIASAFENFALNTIVSNTSSISLCEQLWIGGNDFGGNGQYSWSDGHPFQYSNWGTGQPDLRNQCVSQARTTGQWKTESCATENCFICEAYATTAQMTDCYDWRTIGGAHIDGIYRISPPGIDPFNVWCDMTTEGGGWTVFQKRMDNSTRFWDRVWTEYKDGFNTNDLAGNYWLGLDRVHILSTKDTKVTLRIDLHGNRCNSSFWCPGASPNTYWYQERDFSIADESDSYRLSLTRTTAGNMTNNLISMDHFFNNSNAHTFETVDRNQNFTGCETNSDLHLGAWWSYDGCTAIALNGGYYARDYGGYQYGFCFLGFHMINPIRSEMKLRKY